MDNKFQIELNIIVKTKELINYIFRITQSCPKKFRFSLIAKMQNLSLDILSYLYKANEVFIDTKLLKDVEISIKHLQENNHYKTNEEKFYNENKLLTLKLTKATKFDEKLSKRMDYQFAALTNIKELDYIVTVSKEMQCINDKQHENIAKIIYDMKNLLGAWIKNDKKRYNY
jgi:hypothetical protein